MKILALENEMPSVDEGAFHPLLKAEALKVWQLHQAGIIREIYFRQDKPLAVLVLECENAAEARQVLTSLPLVQEGLISFEVIPLQAYPGFSRLFEIQPES